MMAIFLDIIEKIIEVFIIRCEETNLVLNWEKCHFMVKEGIVLGHQILARGIEVDKAKIETIEKLPPPSSLKGIRSFLGHIGFYRIFIKDFPKYLSLYRIYSFKEPLLNLMISVCKHSRF